MRVLRYVYVVTICAWSMVCVPMGSVHASGGEQPVMHIAAPEYGAVVGPDDRVRVEIAGVPQDAVAIMVKCDETQIGTLSKAPYVLTLRTKPFRVGLHTLNASARMKNGETLDAEAVGFSVFGGSMYMWDEHLGVVPDGSLLVRRGTAIPLCLIQKLEGGKANVGDEVKLVVADDVLGPGGVILIPHGSLAYGSVTESCATSYRKVGRVGLDIEDVVVGTVSIPVDYSETRESLCIEQKGPAIPIPNPEDPTDARQRSSIGTTFRQQWDYGMILGAVLQTGALLQVFVSQDIALKPVGYRVSDAKASNLLKIQLHLQQEVIPVGQALSVDVSVQPRDQVRAVDVLIDHQHRDAKNDVVSPLKIQTEGLARGQHKLCIEVILNDGGVVVRTLDFTMQ
jgi:hypothetical protein